MKKSDSVAYFRDGEVVRGFSEPDGGFALVHKLGEYPAHVLLDLKQHELFMSYIPVPTVYLHAVLVRLYSHTGSLCALRVIRVWS